MDLLIASLVTICMVDISLAQLQCGWSESYFLGLDYSACSYNGLSFYCATPYECCDNGCCLRSDYDEVFSDGELAALILGTSGLFMLGMLALLIFGATYCRLQDDGSVLFGAKSR